MVVRLKWWIQRNPFSNLFLFIKSSQWLSNEGKYMIEDVVKSRCSKDAGEIVRQKERERERERDQNGLFDAMV